MARIKYTIDFGIIWKKINDSLSEEEEQQLEKWLVEDEKHKVWYKKIKKFYKKGSSFDKLPADIQVAWQKVIGQIEGEKRVATYKLFAYAASVAACLLLFLNIYLLWPENKNEFLEQTTHEEISPGSNKARLTLNDGSSYFLSEGKQLNIEEGGTVINSQGSSLEYKKQDHQPNEIKFNTLQIPRGGEFYLMLSDSTKVWLNSETTLKYPAQFGNDERVVELIGEAFFEVTENKNKPFKVLSGEQVVEVYGTSFNISSYEDEPLTYTTLVDGKVNVYLKDNPEMHQVLLPNYQSYLFKDEKNISLRSVDPEEFIAWKTGRFYFNNKTLRDIMKTLSRWYDVNVVFVDAEASRIRFTGDLKRYESFEQILTLIEKTYEVNFEIDGRNITIN